MPSKTVVRLAALTAVVTASVVGAAAPAAQADLITYCIGTGGAVTVPNDLYVPPGESCALEGTTITGNVQVAGGANLVVNNGNISGEIRVAADGYLDTSGTTVGGQIVLAAGGFGVFLKNGTSGTVTLRPKGSQTIEGFLYVENTSITGNVAVNVGEARLDANTQVTGNVNSSGAYYTDVHDSFVDGALSVLNNATGSVVCGSAVRGKATFAGNLGGVQLGPNGTLDGCASGSYFGRDVSISNTSGGVSLDDNIINGQLQLASNNPAAVVAPSNRIRGGVTGDQAPGRRRGGTRRCQVGRRPSRHGRRQGRGPHLGREDRGGRGRTGQAEVGIPGPAATGGAPSGTGDGWRAAGRTAGGRSDPAARRTLSGHGTRPPGGAVRGGGSGRSAIRAREPAARRCGVGDMPARRCGRGTWPLGDPGAGAGRLAVRGGGPGRSAVRAREPAVGASGPSARPAVRPTGHVCTLKGRDDVPPCPVVRGRHRGRRRSETGANAVAGSVGSRGPSGPRLDGGEDR